MDRRALFFLFAAALVAALIPLTDAEFRFVPIGLAIVYVVLALASYLEKPESSVPDPRPGSRPEPLPPEKEHKPAGRSAAPWLLVLAALLVFLGALYLLWDGGQAPQAPAVVEEPSVPDPALTTDSPEPPPTTAPGAGAMIA